MLTRIWVKNIACFGDAENRVDLAPETVIVGPNNVGKSALIAGFNFLRNTRFANLQFDTSSYGWDSFETITYRHERGRVMKLGAEIKGKEWSGLLELEWAPGQQLIWHVVPEGPHDGIQRELSNIWYLLASRSDVPRQTQVGSQGLTTSWRQPLNPDGSNVVTFLLERYTSRDPRWSIAEDWLKKIVPEFSLLKSPLRGSQGSIETEHAKLGVDINLAYQGTGTQKVLSTIAALVFSPEGSTVIVEEPEIHLHPRSQEVLIDLFNLAVTRWGKQVIFTTHSWDMLLPLISDVGDGSERGKTHVKADPKEFKLVTFARDGDQVKIEDYDLENKDFMKVRAYFKQLWG
jgi:hypothetical protein